MSDVLPFRCEMMYGPQIAQLGRGVYGVVNKHRLPSNENTFVAIKKYRLETDGCGDYTWALLGSIYKEIAVLRRCIHPNVVQLIDVFLDRHSPAGWIRGIVMPMADMDLLHLYKKEEMNIEIVRSIAYQMAVGIQYMHDCDVSCGDVKPENVLLFAADTAADTATNTGNSCKWHVRLCDFGIAVMGLGRRGNKCTTDAQSLWYRAPETIMHCEYTFKSEVWAYGCVVFEMATKWPLIQAKSDEGALRQLELVFGTEDQELATVQTNSYVVLPTTTPLIPPILSTQSKKSPWELQKDEMDHQLYTLLSRIFKTCPEERIGMPDVLKDPFFSDISTDISIKTNNVRMKACNIGVWEVVTIRCRLVTQQALSALFQIMGYKNKHSFYHVVMLCRLGCNKVYQDKYTDNNDGILAVSCAYITLLLYEVYRNPSEALRFWGLVGNEEQVGTFLDLQAFVVKQLSGDLMPVLLIDSIQDEYCKDEESITLVIAGTLSLLACIEASLPEKEIAHTCVQLARMIREKPIKEYSKTVVTFILVALDNITPTIHKIVVNMLIQSCSIDELRNACWKVLKV